MVGSLLVSVSSMTAWAAGREPAVEPAPMDALVEAKTASVVSWDLPVTRNESVEDWIAFLKGRNADKTKLWMERSTKYAPMIQAKLRERNMPEDLIYLAFIESGFSPKARSSAAAVGIWQFIEETGKRYGLAVDRYVDERRDPVEATDAALTYLTELYDRFGSWYLAAAAYNTGENRVARIMREETGSERGVDADFWRIADRLPRETRNYVPLMLAAGHIGKEPGSFGFTEIEYQAPSEYETVWVPDQTDLASIAEATGAVTDSIAELNPHILRGVTPPGRAYQVRIPAGTQTAFAANFPAIYKANATARAVAAAKAKAPAKVAKVAAKRHTVRKGETLSHISKRYDLSVRKIQALNGMGRKTTIRPGQKLRVS